MLSVWLVPPLKPLLPFLHWHLPCIISLALIIAYHHWHSHPQGKEESGRGFPHAGVPLDISDLELPHTGTPVAFPQYTQSAAGRGPSASFLPGLRTRLLSAHEINCSLHPITQNPPLDALPRVCPDHLTVSSTVIPRPVQECEDRSSESEVFLFS